jgi:PIN domain nuclease of toxin-antitoxin system
LGKSGPSNRVGAVKLRDKSKSFLLDTHALIWWLTDIDRLPEAVRRAIFDNTNDIYVSAVTALEISTKFRIGKLPILGHLVETLEEQIIEMRFEFLDLTFKDGLVAGQLDYANRDPFDRLLISQAMNHGIALISNEASFDLTGVTRLW